MSVEVSYRGSCGCILIVIGYVLMYHTGKYVGLIGLIMAFVGVLLAVFQKGKEPDTDDVYDEDTDDTEEEKETPETEKDVNNDKIEENKEEKKTASMYVN